ncbi:sulfatase-like hydrolase/transferase [Tamlana sp. 2201CG12-4]|uniref:sulfatase-like hydrolase/transferase n=1 Tax=Tamlana sp. 2201CG12-4 TaxID=3112582 RepID=UPI002DBCE8C4|nr:sulfatase-like hydrolase/transferase [Tamlana sp. 2201CG12-4]MEC3907222.1 sulfatase-like hydrolase/transferase [Tamlana sp. 2201CG12-4]
MDSTRLVFTLLSLLAFLGVDEICQAQQDRPNVILIMADDMGWGDTGYNGHPRIKTPHLDDMANQGIQFTRFYAAGPVCSPTRGSVLTGRNPNRYGITTANVGHLKKEEVTLAEVFKANGYKTGHFGKWHLGTLFPDYSGKGPRRNPGKNYMTPKMAGFDTYFSSEFSIATFDPYKRDKEHAHAKDWLEKGDKRVLYVKDDKPVEDDLTGCDSKIIMDRVLPFIKESEKDKKPFFTVIWFHAPHEPVVGHPKYMKELYSDLEENKQHYYSVITALDAQVGRLRSTLREIGIAENTMICFTSDNGPEGNPEAMKRRQGSTNGLRGRKRSLYEGGIRVPGIIEWPSKVTSGISAIPVVTSDYFPTFCSILGYDVVDNRPYDGISLLPVLNGKIKVRKKNIGFWYRSHKQQALIGDRYKLLHNIGNDRARSDNSELPRKAYELYDIIQDPEERNNIIEANKELAERMKVALAQFVQSCEESNSGSDY